MSNMKAVAFIKLVLGDVEYGDMLMYALHHMDEDCGFPVDIEYDGKPCLVIGASEDMPAGVTIEDVTSCLKDHIDNTNMNDWLEEVTGDFEVQEDTYVVAQQGTYYGPHIVVHVTIIEYA